MLPEALLFVFRVAGFLGLGVGSLIAFLWIYTKARVWWLTHKL